MTSISAFSNLQCATCETETLHVAGVCNHCKTKFTAPPVKKLSMHQVMTFNYQQHPGSRPARRK